MGYDLIGDFFSIIDVSLFNNAAVLLIASFLIWEIPRSIKLLSDEYTIGLYPETGRVIDFFLFAVGFVTIVFLMMGNNIYEVVSFLKTPGITAFFLIIMILVPVIIILGFLKRFFGRFDGNNSVTVFLAHGFLDLMHTIFYTSLVILVIPTLGYLIVG